jgi:UDP-N-acetylglucosamine 2-epimerase (non-hydrolysing)
VISTDRRQRILSVFGTRPEAIKMAPVIAELGRRPSHFESTICVTGQHREMLDQVLDLFEVAPDHDLDVMTPEQTLSGIMTTVIERLDPLLVDLRPDWVLVQGDTTTTVAAALAAFHRGIPVAHVEAGLRTGNIREPMPEEMNRRVTTVLASRHFAPTHLAAANLRVEGVSADRIVVTGNTVIDAFQEIARLPHVPQGALVGVGSDDRRLVLATMHRRENHGVALSHICAALRTIAEQCDDVQIVVPVHLNPNVYERVHCALGGLENVVLVPPLEYRSLIWLLTRSCLVISDSGGLQEEAVSAGKPVLVLRETTERLEGVQCGMAELVGTATDTIVGRSVRLLRNPAAYAAMVASSNPYGDGKAATRIVDTLQQAAPAYVADVVSAAPALAATS